MKIVNFISRLILGLVFVFSGFVKAIDPMGSAIKFGEYFDAFHIGFLHFAAIPLAIVLSAAELMIGLSLLAGLRMKFTSWLLLLFMSFFTLLTFMSALLNPVSDCGCFGDALKLTNWQTFGKNVVLFIPVLIVFIHRKQQGLFGNARLEWGMKAFNFILATGISIYCIIHQPLLDFRPYKTGTYIPEKMNIPRDAPVDEYITRLIYEKDGHRQEFTEQNYPWQDTTWKWVETSQKLVKKGYEPPIHNFSITTGDGTDITNRVLTDSGYVLLFVIPDIKSAARKGMQKLNELALKSRELSFTVYALTASANNQIASYKSTFQPAYDICTADETTLKTIIRANPGILLLFHGTILDKWNYRDAPAPGELKNNLLSLTLEHQQRWSNIFQVAAIFLLIAVLYVTVYKVSRHETLDA
jgi:uncharacterized membrane protein YphA (DoxX/SURF4 family)